MQNLTLPIFLLARLPPSFVYPAGPSRQPTDVPTLQAKLACSENIQDYPGSSNLDLDTTADKSIHVSISRLNNLFESCRP